MPQKSISVINNNNIKYISIHEFINEIEIHNSFDIITGRGKLLYKGSVAVYQVGISAIILNGRLIREDSPVIREKGEILLPLSFFKKIMDDFFPFYELAENKNRITIQSRAIPSQEPGTRQRPDEQLFSASADRISFIIIDPGHGGKDPGAIGKGGLKEKWITLKISKILEDYLKTRLKNIKIKLTRSSDKFIELAERTQMANRMLKKKENGLFISIHVNASILHSVSGFETYFLSQNPSNEEARTTAALENNVIILEENTRKNAYNDVQHVEAIMLNTQIQKESSMLAGYIQKNIDEKILESKSKGVKNADFFVLRGSLMPAVLVEVGFISNVKEAGNLKKYNYQKKLAHGIGEGIMQFIKEYNKNIKK